MGGADLATAVRWLENSRFLVAFTGAGMSADSGVPTFRGADGLWRGYRAEELATPAAFESDREKVIEWYRWRREVVAAAQPHRGHQALAREETTERRVTVITQNVDGLHQRAGSSDVIELHGSILINRCHRCGRSREDDQKGDPDWCSCGGAMRPGVVWFGESLPQQAWRAAETAIAACDLVLVVGTSAVVQPAASLLEIASTRRIPIIEVNPRPVLTHPVLTLSCRAVDGLSELFG